MPTPDSIHGTFTPFKRALTMKTARIVGCTFAGHGTSPASCCGSEPIGYTITEPPAGTCTMVFPPGEPVRFYDVNHKLLNPPPVQAPAKSRGMEVAENLVRQDGSYLQFVTGSGPTECRDSFHLAGNIYAEDAVTAIRPTIANIIDTGWADAEAIGEARGRKAEREVCVKLVEEMWEAALRDADYEAAMNFRSVRDAIRYRS